MIRTELKRFFAELLDEVPEPTIKRKHWRHKILRVFGLYLVSVVLSTFLLVVYVSQGHDKGWPRAALWHQRLVKHHVLFE